MTRFLIRRVLLGILIGVRARCELLVGGEGAGPQRIGREGRAQLGRIVRCQDRGVGVARQKLVGGGIALGVLTRNTFDPELRGIERRRDAVLAADCRPRLRLERRDGTTRTNVNLVETSR